MGFRLPCACCVCASLQCCLIQWCCHNPLSLPDQFAAVVPPAYACLNPDMSLSLGQTMALIFPPDDPKGKALGH